MKNPAMSATCNEKAPSVSKSRSVPSTTRGARRALYHVWRIIISGISFIVFMGLSLLFALVVFPSVRIFSRANETKGRRIRSLIHFMFAQFIKFWVFIGVMRPPKVTGKEVLDAAGPCIVVANHPTLIDAVLLGSLIPDFNCVVKHSLRDHFFLGGPVRAAGWVTNDNAAQVIRSCRDGFERGQSLIIFPEGSRSIENGLRPFSRGAAQLALRSGVPLIPAVIRCSPPSLMKHQKWHDVPDRPFELNIDFHSPLVCGPASADNEPLPRKARRFTKQIEDFFQRELNRDVVQRSSGPS